MVPLHQTTVLSTQTIFADGSYTKPYFVTYFTTNMFTVFLLARLLQLVQRRVRGRASARRRQPAPSSLQAEGVYEEHEQLIRSEHDSAVNSAPAAGFTDVSSSPLNFRQTAVLALQFCALWFAANYFQYASLEHTSVASAVIFFSTAGIWTLLFGSLLHVEAFSLRKLLGVLASLAGIVIITFGDVFGKSDEHRGSFPHKTPVEVALGDGLALASAVLYGLYTTLLKKNIGDEKRVDMLLFLGFVGLANTILVWPGLVALHFAGWERFGLPDTRRDWTIILVCLTWRSMLGGELTSGRSSLMPPSRSSLI